MHQKRRDNLRQLLTKTGADALLVTSFTNVTYLTGFTGDDSFLLLTPQDEIVISDFRYDEQLTLECPGLKLDIRTQGTSIYDQLERLAKQLQVGKLGVEMTVTLGQQAEIAKKLPSLEFVKTEGLVEQLREIKDAGEVQEIREAIRFAERAFGVMKASLRGESTEREIAFELERQIRLFGGDSCSFKPIIAVGDRAALPHYRPGPLRICDAEFVLVDWGARGRLYVSDLTRVLATSPNGKAPPRLAEIYEIVLQAQLAGIAAIKPGAALKDVDGAARSVIERAGYGKQFGHGLGHGIGLQVHESPRMASNQDGALKAGMVITVEPGIYVPGWGGVRIEDDVLVTESGHEVLSSVSKDLADCLVAT